MTLSGSNMKTSLRPKNPFGSSAGNTVFLQVFCMHSATCFNAPEDFVSVALCFLSSKVTANLKSTLQSVSVCWQSMQTVSTVLLSVWPSLWTLGYICAESYHLVVIGTCVMRPGWLRQGDSSGERQENGLLLHNLPTAMASLGWLRLFWGEKEFLLHSSTVLFLSQICLSGHTDWVRSRMLLSLGKVGERWI